MRTADVVIPSHARGDGSRAALAQAGARNLLWSPGGLSRRGTGTHPARHKAAREKGGQKPSPGHWDGNTLLLGTLCPQGSLGDR